MNFSCLNNWKSVTTAKKLKETIKLIEIELTKTNTYKDVLVKIQTAQIPQKMTKEQINIVLFSLCISLDLI